MEGSSSLMGLIAEDAIQQVVDRADIVGVISSYVSLKPAGRNFKALCPFHHEKTPSFVVNPDKQIFHCFGCHAGGNVIGFVMQQERLSFPEAVQSLAERYGVCIETAQPADAASSESRQQLKLVLELAAQYYHGILLTHRGAPARAARQYLKGRGLTIETVRKFRLGFATDNWEDLFNYLKSQGVLPALIEKAGLVVPRANGAGYYDRFRNRITFPIFDVRSQCIAFGGRTMEADNPAKYINSPETAVYRKGEHLFGLSFSREAVVKHDRAVIVEGYMDFLTPFAAGVGNVAAALGTALTVGQIRLLRRFTRNVTMLFDADTAGQAATLRSLDLLVEEGMAAKVATLASGEDPDSFLRKYGPEEFSKRLEEASPLFDFKFQALLAQYGNRTVEARARIAEEMLATINKFSNTIVRTEYIKQLAQALDIKEEALGAELKKLRPAVRPPREPAAPNPRLGPAAAERNLLWLLLLENEFIPLTREKVDVADFRNQRVRAVVVKIFELFEKGAAVDCPRLMSHFADPETLRLIAQVTAEADCVAGDRRRIHEDCCERLRQDSLRIRRQEIRRRIDEARASGDEDGIAKLIREFNQLIKR